MSTQGLGSSGIASSTDVAFGCGTMRDPGLRLIPFRLPGSAAFVPAAAQ